jgi:FkbM family methyltransferase
VIRVRLFPFVWKLLWPARLFIKRSPFTWGKGFVQSTFLEPFLPPNAHTFAADLFLGTTVRVRYREAIGLGILLNGAFEAAEIKDLCSHVRPGSTAVDVGANIGVYTAVLSRAVGTGGSVIAIEPVQENVDRLKHNLRINGAENVKVFPIAVSEKSEMLPLHLSDDPAFHSTAAIAQERALVRSTRVAARSLDSVWSEAGRPSVSVLKIDVEGAELAVIRGAEALLSTCKPALLIEITSASQLAEINDALAAYDYRWRQPQGFMTWNYMFIAERTEAQNQY